MRNARGSFPTQNQACRAGWKVLGSGSSARYPPRRSSCR